MYQLLHAVNMWVPLFGYLTSCNVGHYLTLLQILLIHVLVHAIWRLFIGQIPGAYFLKTVEVFSS